jgi:hypothetical protein
MRYLLLIYSQEVPPEQVPQDEVDKVMGEYYAFTEAITKSGVNKGGEALMPTAVATTVRVKDGKRTVTDGPFAETKEALGGYYLLDVKDLNEAIDVAAKCPGAKYGSIELRPIMEFPQQ